MEVLLGLSFGWRLIFVALLGALVGRGLCILFAMLHWEVPGTYPWNGFGKRREKVSRLQRIPIFGYLIALKRLSQKWWRYTFGIELFLAIAFALLYWFEVEWLGMFPGAVSATSELLRRAHLQYVSHLFLLSLFTLILVFDFATLSAPVVLIRVGMLIGLLFATLAPLSLPPGTHLDGTLALSITALAPLAWNPSLDSVFGGIVGFSCLLAWWVWQRWGYRLDSAAEIEDIVPDNVAQEDIGVWSDATLNSLNFALVACLVLGWCLGGVHWQGCFTALFSMILHVLPLVALNLVIKSAIGYPGLGSGDIDIAAIVGVFFGWQCNWVLFVGSGIVGLLLAVLMLFRSLVPSTVRVGKGLNVLPFLPALCVGATVMMVCWSAVWQYVIPLQMEIIDVLCFLLFDSIPPSALGFFPGYIGTSLIIVLFFYPCILFVRGGLRLGGFQKPGDE